MPPSTIPSCDDPGAQNQCKSPENNAEFTNQWACRCKANANPPLPKKWPDPYRGTPYEDDLKLCYGLQSRPFSGCGYPYQGSFPGQFGKFQTADRATSYPWATLDWPCPSRFMECCHYDPWEPTPPFDPQGGELPCFYQIPDGEVIGKYSPCCCSEYYGACRNVCDQHRSDDPDNEADEDICGCWPRRQLAELPLCLVPDGRVLNTQCPRGADYSISDIAPKRKNGQNVVELCGGMKLYTRRNSKYTLCGGYKLTV